MPSKVRKHLLQLPCRRLVDVGNVFLNSGCCEGGLFSSGFSVVAIMIIVVFLCVTCFDALFELSKACFEHVEWRFRHYGLSGNCREHLLPMFGSEISKKYMIYGLWTTQEAYGLWSTRGLWVISCNQLGESQNLWVRTSYGLSQVWGRTESTVLQRECRYTVKCHRQLYVCRVRTQAGSAASMSSPFPGRGSYWDGLSFST
jgi:hypothetical protein